MSRKYDIIIFGATGLIGKYCVEDVVRIQRDKHSKLYSKFSWAVAGRSEKKLVEMLQQVSDYTGVDVTKVDKIVADHSNFESLRAMASQCSVVVNCVGPYLLYGEDVVKACISTKTSHVDISGEQSFVERMQIENHLEAEENDVYIISSCGFGSIVTDCGITYLQKHFKGDINSVDSITESNLNDQPAKMHFGTYHSIIQSLANMSQTRKLQKLLMDKPMPNPEYSTRPWFQIKYSEEAKGYICLVGTGPDPAVVKRSQYHFYTKEQRYPIQYNPYIKLPGIFTSIMIGIIGLIILALSQFRLGFYLIETYPRFFTLGVVSYEGPTRKQAASVDFKVTMIATGWKERIQSTGSPETYAHVEPPKETLKLQIRGKNPGYAATTAMFIEAALTIVFEKDRLPSKGGVFPPGVAFEKTTIIDRINAKGISFQIVDDQSA